MINAEKYMRFEEGFLKEAAAQGLDVGFLKGMIAEASEIQQKWAEVFEEAEKESGDPQFRTKLANEIVYWSISTNPPIEKDANWLDDMMASQGGEGVQNFFNDTGNVISGAKEGDPGYNQHGGWGGAAAGGVGGGLLGLLIGLLTKNPMLGLMLGGLGGAGLGGLFGSGYAQKHWGGGDTNLANPEGAADQAHNGDQIMDKSEQGKALNAANAAKEQDMIENGGPRPNSPDPSIFNQTDTPAGTSAVPEPGASNEEAVTHEQMGDQGGLSALPQQHTPITAGKDPSAMAGTDMPADPNAPVIHPHQLDENELAYKMYAKKRLDAQKAMAQGANTSTLGALKGEDVEQGFNDIGEGFESGVKKTFGPGNPVDYGIDRAGGALGNAVAGLGDPGNIPPAKIDPARIAQSPILSREAWMASRHPSHMPPMPPGGPPAKYAPAVSTTATPKVPMPNVANPPSQPPYLPGKAPQLNLKPGFGGVMNGLTKQQSDRFFLEDILKEAGAINGPSYSGGTPQYGDSMGQQGVQGPIYGGVPGTTSMNPLLPPNAPMILPPSQPSMTPGGSLMTNKRPMREI